MANTWGSETWSFNQWNDLANVSYTLTGQDLSLSLGDETTAGEINTGWGRQEWNAQAWGIAGTLIPTGESLSANLNSVTVTAEINVGWSSDTWGYETWGTSGQLADVTGISLSLNLGTVAITADASTIPTGELITGNTGTAQAFASFTQEVTGIPMTMTLSFDPEIVSPVGQELTSSLGTATLDANTIAEVSTTVPSYYGTETWGYGAWGNEPVETLAMTSDEGTVDPSPDATVTGIGFNASLAVGTVVIGEANVTVVGEGFGAALGVGTLDAVTLADLTGIAMSANLGGVTVIGEATTPTTGIDLTMALGTNRTLIWNQINTGTAPIWTEVDTAA